MPQLPAISGKSFLKFLQAIGFVLVRINGSHHPFFLTEITYLFHQGTLHPNKLLIEHQGSKHRIITD